MKNILGVHNKASNLAVHTELGLTPLCFKAFKLMYKYYKRLMIIDKSKEYVYDLLRSAFEEDRKLKNENCSSWGKSVEQLKNLFNLDNLDISPIQFNKEMQDYYASKVTNQLTQIKTTQSGKLRFFCKITEDFELQTYLKFNINKNLRSILTRLRLSAHSLAIETGRYCKPLIPANERYCVSCKNKVEDENNFLLECPLYNSIRDKFFTLFKTDFNETLEETTKRLLNPCTPQDLDNLCFYLKEAYSLRDTEHKNA